MTTTTTDRAAAVERYVRFWNTTEPAEQQRLATDTFTDDIAYHAPVGVLSGAAALIEFREQLTGHVGPVEFAPRAEPDGHHDRARLRWELRLANGDSFAEGTDVLVLGEDGRVTSVSTFLDRAPEGFDH
jgi:SnoaL-like protein